MKLSKILALVLAFCMILSIGALASGMPDTSKGGQATSRPPDNSTKAVDILGGRAAIYIEYGENGYTLSQNITDDYTVETQGELSAPASGEMYTLGGISIYCDAEAWNEENAVGNSGIVINELTDENTPVVFGGDEDFYKAPDGEMYNSVIVMRIDENEALPESATETAPGVGIAFNGSVLEIKNAYVESNGTGRPSVHIPSTTRDKNATQLPDLICVDSMFINHDTRALLLMGGDVWFLNSTVLTNAWGGLSYDNTSTTMYVVNSDVENIGSGGYAIYDAAGCTAYIYGSRVIGGNTAITVCRNAELTVDDLDKADKTATAPYDGAADLMTPAVTDGRSEIIAHDYAIKMHADMSGADSQAVAYLNNAYLSTLDEDVAFADGTAYADWAKESTGIKGIISAYQSGACVVLSSHNGKVVFDGSELYSRTGVLVHSLFSYDSMASGIYPQDGVEYAGDEVTLANMSAEGDILHEDYMRKMELTLENAELTGKVVGTTLAAWNGYWTDVVDAMDEEELSDASGEMDAKAATLVNCIYNDTYETMWGVRMTMDGSSVWNITGDSNLYSFTMAEGAQITGAAEIYVDCAMDNALESYDISTGTKIDAFEPGVTYTGVVIIADAAPSAAVSLGSAELASLGVETAYADGEYMVSLGGLLEALGADLSYDEQTGTVTVVDESGAIGALIAGMAG